MPPQEFKHGSEPWVSVCELTNATDPKIAVDGGGANDLMQGSIGDCWLVASFAAAVHRNPNYVAETFNPSTGVSPSGAYSVRLFVKSEPRWILVDDLVPVWSKTNKTPVFVKSTDPNEFWVLLLEKAFAKLAGACVSLPPLLPSAG